MKNYHKTSAFTLIEVMVAASILSITIFGVYKLIWENTKLISNKEQYSFTNTLFPSLQECIEHIGFDNFVSDETYHFNFWVDNEQCLRDSSTVTPITLDNIGYYLSWSTVKTTDKIDWTLEVSSDLVRPIQKEYTQLR